MRREGRWPPLRCVAGGESRTAGFFIYTIGNFIPYRINKDAPLRMRTRAKSRVLPDGNRARRECAPGAHFFRTDSDIALMDGRIRGRGYEDSEGDQ